MIRMASLSSIKKGSADKQVSTAPLVNFGRVIMFANGNSCVMPLLSI